MDLNKVASFLILLTACFLATSTGQNSKSLAKKDWYNKALSLYELDEPTEETDSICLSLFLKYAAASPESDPLHTASLIKAGNMHQGYRRFAEANQLYYRAIAANKKGTNKSGLNYEVYLYLGSSLYYSNIDSAKYYFEAASDIALKYTGEELLPDQESLYNSLGAIYYESANYQQSKNYFEKATEFLSVTKDEYKEVFGGIQANIASCLMKMGQHKEALDKLKSFSPDVANKKIISQNTAHCYFELGEYDSALALYRSQPVEKGYPGVVALTDIGRIYMQRKDWSGAEAVFDSAIALNKDISLQIKNKEEALAYLYRSQLARKQGFLEEAVSWINEALKEVHLSFKPGNIEEVPDDVSKSVSAITFFRILVEKAGLLHVKHKVNNNARTLAASLSCYRKAIEVANFIKMNFDNDEAKLFFTQNYRDIYAEAVEVGYEAVTMNKKLVDDYLYIIENYKGGVLYQNLQNIALKSSAAIPENIRKREKEIKDLLAVYTTRINQSSSEKDAEQLQKRLLNLQVELSRLQQEYEEDPVYAAYKLQFSKPGQTLSALQSQLDSKTALLNYFTTDSVIYCFAVTSNDFRISRTPVDTTYLHAFEKFTNEVYMHQEGKRYDGYSSSFLLYNFLLKPVEKITQSRKKWIIIPDGKLYYISFDALVSDENKKDYLVLSKTISYHYSFSLLFSNNLARTDRSKNEQILAYAPYIQNDLNIYDSKLPALPLSADEVKNITQKVFLGNKATRNHFLNEAGKYPIIHLATHASIGTDSNNNWIQFYPENLAAISKLYLPEIYNLNLHQTELVVLSACETGGGKAVAGEGFLSISRAFMYAGAGGVVSTLWKSEDFVTAYLMQRMHRYIKQKKPPEMALQLAKKDLISDDNIGVRYKSPNYWANFVYAGKNHPEEKKWWSWWWIIGLITAGSISYLVVRKTKKLRFSETQL